MRHEFQVKMPEVLEKISFYIGDVHDLASVKNAMHGVENLFAGLLINKLVKVIRLTEKLRTN